MIATAAAATTPVLTQHQLCLTNGCHNRTVRDHASTCHHCGMLVGEVRTCRSCGVRAHPECVDFADDECDACRLDLHDHVCAVCGMPDTADAVQCGTQRLIKCVVYYGRTWREGSDPDALFVSSDHDVALKLAEDPTAVFHPDELPCEGAERMMTRTADGVAYVSNPLVAHTWCVECAFQQIIPDGTRPGADVSERWRCLLDGLHASTARTFAQSRSAATSTGAASSNPCCFCEERSGFRTFCFAHTSSKSAQGCTSCHWPQRPHLTYRCFHPSCAVRHGMKRVVTSHGDGSGMMCVPASNKFINDVNPISKRSANCRTYVFSWMEASSGINMNVFDALAVCEITCDVPITAKRFGDMVCKPVTFQRPLRHHRRVSIAPRCDAAYGAPQPPNPRENAREDDERDRTHHGSHAQEHQGNDNPQDAPMSSLGHWPRGAIHEDANSELITRQRAFEMRLLKYVHKHIGDINKRIDALRLTHGGGDVVGEEEVVNDACNRISRHTDLQMELFTTVARNVREHFK